MHPQSVIRIKHEYISTINILITDPVSSSTTAAPSTLAAPPNSSPPSPQPSQRTTSFNGPATSRTLHLPRPPILSLKIAPMSRPKKRKETVSSKPSYCLRDRFPRLTGELCATPVSSRSEITSVGGRWIVISTTCTIQRFGHWCLRAAWEMQRRRRLCPYVFCVYVGDSGQSEWKCTV